MPRLRFAGNRRQRARRRSMPAVPPIPKSFDRLGKEGRVTSIATRKECQQWVGSRPGSHGAKTQFTVPSAPPATWQRRFWGYRVVGVSGGRGVGWAIGDKLGSLAVEMAEELRSCIRCTLWCYMVSLCLTNGTLLKKAGRLRRLQRGGGPGTCRSMGSDDGMPCINYITSRVQGETNAHKEGREHDDCDRDTVPTVEQRRNFRG